MKIKFQIIAIVTFVTINSLKAQWNTGGNTLTGTLPSSPNEWLGSSNAGDFIIKTNNSERLRVLSTGNVGIGTTSPTSKLNVKGADVSLEESTTDAGANLLFKRQDATARRLIGANPSGTTGVFDLIIGQNSGLWRDIYFTLNGGDKMIIKADGSVGIGTTSPGTKLEVAG